MATSGAFSTTNKYIKYTISVKQNSRDISGNTSSVTVSVRVYRTNTGYTTAGSGTVYCKINGTTYSTAMTFSHKITNSGITIFTKTLEIPHNADGSKTLTCSAWFNHSQFTSSEQSYSQALTAIPRASVISSISGDTIGSPVTINLTTYSSSFTHKYYYTFGDSKNVGVNKTFTPSLNDCSYIPNSSSGTATIKVETYNGSTLLGSNSKSFTLNVPASVKPTCKISVSDPTGYLTTYGGYVYGKSKFKVAVTGTPSYGSPINSYRTTANDSTYTSASFTTDAIKVYGSATISATVTDKRGKTSNAATATATILEYRDPMIENMSVNRCDQNGADNEQGEYVKVTYDCNMVSLKGKNKLKSSIKYKKTTDPNYTSGTNTTFSTTPDRTTMVGETSIAHYINKSVIFAADSGSSYDIELTVTDNFGPVTKHTTVSTAFTFQHFKGPFKNGDGKNLCLTDIKDWKIGQYDTAGGAGAYDSRARLSALIKVPTNTILYCNTFLPPYVLLLRLYDANKKFIKTFNTAGNNLTFSTSGISYLGVNIYNPSNDTGTMGQTILNKIASGEIRPLICLDSEADKTYEPYIYAYKASMGLGKLAEFEGGLDIGFQTRFDGGFKQPVLIEGTNLNNVMVPNVYTGKNISDYSYANAPIPTGTFTLTVKEAGPEGQIKQIIESCDKVNGGIWERHYYQDSWGKWIRISDYRGTVLWSGGWYMTAGHVANLNQPISQQPSGIVLIFSYYNGGEKDTDFNSFFVPKQLVQLKEGKSHNFILTDYQMANVSQKLLYISDSKIQGDDNNNKVGTGYSGITYANNKFVLRYVIGV